MSDIEILRYLSRNDPAARETEPTQAACDAYLAWVRKQFGPKIGDAYAAGNWEPAPEV